MKLDISYDKMAMLHKKIFELCKILTGIFEPIAKSLDKAIQYDFVLIALLWDIGRSSSFLNMGVTLDNLKLANFYAIFQFCLSFDCKFYCYSPESFINFSASFPYFYITVSQILQQFVSIHFCLLLDLLCC